MAIAVHSLDGAARREHTVELDVKQALGHVPIPSILKLALLSKPKPPWQEPNLYLQTRDVANLERVRHVLEAKTAIVAQLGVSQKLEFHKFVIVGTYRMNRLVWNHARLLRASKLSNRVWKMWYSVKFKGCLSFSTTIDKIQFKTHEFFNAQNFI
jgi:hypothetical protein